MLASDVAVSLDRQMAYNNRSLRRLRTSFSAIAAAMFAAGATGAVFEPWDLTSLYQSRTGGANVSAGGQTVGLMLDKSRMGGKTAAEFIAAQPELVTNGGFNSDTDWTHVGSAISGGLLTVTRIGSFAYAQSQNIPVVAGKTYALRYKYRRVSGTGHARVQIRTNPGGIERTTTAPFGTSATQESVFVIYTSAATETVQLWPAALTSDCVVEFDDVSFLELPGFHAVAFSDNARPLYGRLPTAASMAAQPELLTNGSFASASGWSTTTWTVTGGRAEFGPAWGGNQIVRSDLTMQAGKTYLVEFDSSTHTGMGMAVDDGVASKYLFPQAGSPARYSLAVTMQATRTFRILALSTGAVNQWVDNVSVKEVPPGATWAPFLLADGTDDWMQVFPTCNLGETWAHVGAWTGQNGGRLFATSSNSIPASGPRVSNGTTLNIGWIDSAQNLAAIFAGSPLINYAPGVVTIEQESTTAISARVSGQAGQTIVPFNDSADTQGLALFSGRNSGLSVQLGGRFYGGAWIARALADAERLGLEAALLDQIGVAA